MNLRSTPGLTGSSLGKSVAYVVNGVYEATDACALLVVYVAESSDGNDRYENVTHMREEAQLVSSGEAAKAIGVHRATLARWWREGLIEPAIVTPGGQARWNVDDLRRALRNKPDS